MPSSDWGLPCEGPGQCRGNTAAALAETDRDITVPHRLGTEDNLVAVLQPLACFPVRKLQRLRAANAQFGHAGPAFIGRSGRGAAREQITGLQIAAVARVVSDHLGERPIYVPEVCVGNPGRGL